jgi:hypothetical protein
VDFLAKVFKVLFQILKTSLFKQFFLRICFFKIKSKQGFRIDCFIFFLIFFIKSREEIGLDLQNLNQTDFFK